MNKEKTEQIKEEKTSQIKDNVNSISGFFSLSYAIILIASISYNVGYFKYINPQIVDLMTLSDYINNTIHNVWVFLVPVILFYSGSLAYLKRNLGRKFWQFVFLGMSVLILSSFTFLKGFSRERIWPILESLVSESYINTIVILTIIIIPSILFYSIYRFSKAFFRDNLPDYIVSFLPIFVFILLVLIPYMIGSTQGKLENGEVETPNYKCHAISISTVKGDKIDNIYLLKHIEKGLIIKHFDENNKNTNDFFFINWNDISRILYHNSRCLDKSYSDRSKLVE